MAKMGRPKLFNSPEELQEKIEAYFVHQDTIATANDSHLPVYTMSGLAYSLDMDRKSLLNYSKDEQFFPTIKKARNKVEAMVEERLMTLPNATGHIFNLKNNFDWKDKSENEMYGKNGKDLPGITVEFIKPKDK